MPWTPSLLRSTNIAPIPVQRNKSDTIFMWRTILLRKLSTEEWKQNNKDLVAVIADITTNRFTETFFFVGNVIE